MNKFTLAFLTLLLITPLSSNHAQESTMPNNPKTELDANSIVASNIQFEKVLELKIAKTIPPQTMIQDKGNSIRMVPFIGKASGSYFTGQVQPGGVDTQITSPDGQKNISARYLLEGTDYTGAPCQIFIENNGRKVKEVKNNVTFWTHPTIITNSPALNFFNDDFIIGQGVKTPEGTVISFYRAI